MENHPHDARLCEDVDVLTRIAGRQGAGPVRIARQDREPVQERKVVGPWAGGIRGDLERRGIHQAESGLEDGNRLPWCDGPIQGQ